MLPPVCYKIMETWGSTEPEIREKAVWQQSLEQENDHNGIKVDLAKKKKKKKLPSSFQMCP